MGKLFERVFKNDVDNATSRINLIPEMHSGFRSGRSCQENFLRLSEGIAEGLKRKKNTIGAFVDLDKALNAVRHNSLRIKIIRQQLRQSSSEQYPHSFETVFSTLQRAK